MVVVLSEGRESLVSQLVNDLMSNLVEDKEVGEFSLPISPEEPPEADQVLPWVMDGCPRALVVLAMRLMAS